MGDGGPPQKEGDAAEQGGGGGGTEGQCTDLSQRLLFSGAVIPAEKGLRPVPDALDDEVDHADGVAHDRIAGHRQGAAVGQRSPVDDHQRDRVQHGQAEGGQGGGKQAENGPPVQTEAHPPEHPLHPEQIDQPQGGGHPLGDDGGGGGPGGAPAEDGDEQSIQHHIGEEAGGHGAHGGVRPVIGAQQGDQPGAQHLEERAQHDDPGVAVSIGQDGALRAQQREQGAVEQGEQGGRQHAGQQEQHGSGAQGAVLLRGVPAADAHGQHHGGGHAQPGA